MFLVTLLTRGLIVQIFQTEPINDLLWNDAVAWNLAHGNGYTASLSEPRVPGIFRTPGYPGFLAAIYFVFGHSYHAAYIANAVLDAATTVLLAWICMDYVSVPLAGLTAGLYSVYPYPAMFCPVLHQDILLTFSVMCVLLLLAHASRPGSSALRWLWVGIATGISALIKANFVLFISVPAITLFFEVRDMRRRVASMFLLLSGICLVVGPWVMRNYLVFHSFPPLAVGGTGTNLMYLAVEVNEGEPALLKKINGNPPAYTLGDFVDGAPLIAYEKIQTRRALEQLRPVWGRYLLVVLKHIPLPWLSRHAVWHGEWVRVAGLMLSLMVLIPGVIGMMLLRKRWRALLPLYLTIFVITLTYALYTVEARYTMPARPVMLVFVAAAIAALLRRKNWLEAPASRPNFKV